MFNVLERTGQARLPQSRGRLLHNGTIRPVRSLGYPPLGQTGVSIHEVMRPRRTTMLMLDNNSNTLRGLLHFLLLLSIARGYLSSKTKTAVR